MLEFFSEQKKKLGEKYNKFMTKAMAIPPGSDRHSLMEEACFYPFVYEDPYEKTVQEDSDDTTTTTVRS